MCVYIDLYIYIYIYVCAKPMSRTKARDEYVSDIPGTGSLELQVTVVVAVREKTEERRRRREERREKREEKSSGSSRSEHGSKRWR